MNKQLLIGAALLVVLGAVAVFKWTEENAEESPASAGAKGSAPAMHTLPKIDSATVDRLEIAAADKDTVTLAKVDGTWRVVEPLDAAADQDAVTKALEQLGQLEVKRIVAENPENHQRLGVTHDKGVSVVAKAGTQVLAELIIGGYGNGGTMVRKNKDNTVLAVDGSFNYLFNKDLRQWRDRQVLEVPPAQITEIAFDSSEGRFRFVKDEKDEWVQAPGERPIQHFASRKVKDMINTLSNLRATDFAEAGVSTEAAGFGEDPAKVTLTYVPEAPKTDEGEEGTTDPTPASVGDAQEKKATVFLGNALEGQNQRYAMRDGHPEIFVITEYLGKKAAPSADLFQEDPEEKKRNEEAAAAAAAGAGPGGMAGMGMPPGHGMGGGGQVPPEVMRQIQEQLQKQGAQ
ncbi:MAG: DUF4340 domain-containing protein [Myxococcales bacterium]|nr:DUF4340 domain-containing protein [Myxococcales bacterium]